MYIVRNEKHQNINFTLKLMKFRNFIDLDELTHRSKCIMLLVSLTTSIIPQVRGIQAFTVKYSDTKNF